MRILYIGSFNEHNDEGLTKISKAYYRYFSLRYDVLSINTTAILNPQALIIIYKFHPDIIHYLTGPTVRSFVIIFLLKTIFWGKTKTIVSATRPFIRERQLWVLNISRPDLILTQATKWEKLFKRKNINTKFVPNFVDTKKFKRLDVKKTMLRKKYNLPLDKVLLLHVGHIKENRNLDRLVRIQEELGIEKYQIVIVGSTFYGRDMKLYHNLVQSRCIVIDDYISNIEEIYNACDFYVFPLDKLRTDYYPEEYLEVGVVDMPLSILEAMACEMRVVSMPADSIRNLTQEAGASPIIEFDGSASSLVDGIMRNQTTNVDFEKIRAAIDEENVFIKVDKIYKELIAA